MAACGTRSSKAASSARCRYRFRFNYVDSHLQTWSITPRLSIKNSMFGVPSQILTGIDYYDATFHQDAAGVQGRAADPHLRSVAADAGRLLAANHRPVADHRFLLWRPGSEHQPERAGSLRSAIAPGAFYLRRSGLPLDSSETQYALHVGLEHRFNNVFSVFGRAARAFRTPNVDERVSSGPGLRSPSSSRSRRLQAEDPDLARRRGRLPHQVRRLPDAIEHLQHGPRERDPFQSRRCSTTSISIRPAATARRPAPRCASATRVLLRGGMAYTRAVFREGAFAGNDVPLVSRYTASGGVTWNIWQNYLVFDATVRAWSERIMDNDQANTQRRIPADATVDLKLSGAYEHFFWSLSVNNLLNAQYYDYAIASSFTPGRFCGLSAARPDLHGEGRRDVLTANSRFGLHAGPACPDLTRRYSPLARENAFSCLNRFRSDGCDDRRGHRSLAAGNIQSRYAMEPRHLRRHRRILARPRRAGAPRPVGRKPFRR